MDVDNQIQDRLTEFKQHCVANSDHKACAWLFRGGPPLPARRGHQRFSDPHNQFHIYMLDLYHGRHPTLLNLATLKYAHKPRYGIRSYVILDSNVASHVSNYFNGRITHEAQRSAVVSFLIFVLREGLDPSPVFYFMESLARSDVERWREHASRFAEAIIDIQSLDRDLFLAEARPASSLSARASLTSFHEAEHAKNLKDKYVGSLPPEVIESEATKLDLTYAALLKATLLRLHPGRSFSERQSLLGEFMVHDLGVVLGVERFLAAAHWAAPERFAKLMTPLQQGSRPDRVLGKLRSTSWDVYLTRLPEQLGKFLARDVPDNMDTVLNLYYIATAEQALAELAGTRGIELLVQHSDSNRSKIVVGHRGDFLVSLIGHDEASRLGDSIAEWETGVSRMRSRRSQIAADALAALISDLEEEVRIATSAPE